MGIIALAALLTLETLFLVWSIAARNNHTEEKGITSIGILALFGLLLGTGIFEWSFRYIALFAVLAAQAVVSIVRIVRKREKREQTYRLRSIIFRFVGNCVVFSLALAIAILCPQYQQPEMTGKHDVATAKYTWIDSNRVDELTGYGDGRALTVEFWYPDTADERYPLVVFSHGAFGFSGSNYSTCVELASNGYVVASIGHTNQAFYTMDTEGKLTIADPEFINEASQINSLHDTTQEEGIYATTKDWMELRTADMDFVIDTIIHECERAEHDALFSIIDSGRIGLMGHSLGGATSAQIGRTRDDIDAVIVLDGTMLGEEVAFEDDGVVLNDTPYPIPLLNIYAEDHYTSSKELVGDAYNNFHATQNAVCASETVFRGAGHLNFTDLPLFSPVLAQTLGVGTVDASYCIETMNRVVLEYFDCYLRDIGEPKIEREY